MTPRIGHGVDVHAFSEEPQRRLVLGGVEIPDEAGLDGHSDADVVLHALVDALLGAVGGGDIGALFGSVDPRYAGADSSVFLAGALERVHGAGFAVGNVDCTLVAARPRIAAHRDAICDRVAELLGVEGALVSIKATTTDGLGFTGRGEGIACFAVALVVPR